MVENIGIKRRVSKMREMMGSVTLNVRVSNVLNFSSARTHYLSISSYCSEMILQIDQNE